MAKDEPSIERVLTTPAWYAHHILTMHYQSESLSQAKAKSDEITINTLALHKNKIAKIIVQQIKQRVYQPQPVFEHIEWVKDKNRVLCKLNIMDQLVQGAFWRAIAPRLENYLSPYVYSYKNRSNQKAVTNFARYIRQHTENNKVDLLVIRTDVKSYTDTIPLTQNAAVWQQLEALFKWRNYSPHHSNLPASAI